MKAQFDVIRSNYVVLEDKNIDTDQLIPARFMTTTSSNGLGKYLLHDVRHDFQSGKPTDHAINHVNAAECQILVAGANFGCGSSREHAVWALRDFGFRVVLAPRMADIFRSNALNNGLLAIEISDALYSVLLDCKGETLSVNLESQEIDVADFAPFSFKIEPFARYCLMQGIDRLDYLLQHSTNIAAYEERLS